MSRLERPEEDTPPSLPEPNGARTYFPARRGTAGECPGCAASRIIPDTSPDLQSPLMDPRTFTHTLGIRSTRPSHLAVSVAEGVDAVKGVVVNGEEWVEVEPGVWEPPCVKSS